MLADWGRNWRGTFCKSRTPTAAMEIRRRRWGPIPPPAKARIEEQLCVVSASGWAVSCLTLIAQAVAIRPRDMHLPHAVIVRLGWIKKKHSLGLLQYMLSASSP